MTRKPTSDPARRALLLDAAARLFERDGPNGTTVADIARAAGVSVGSVYLEFPGKGGILAALSERRLQGVCSAMARAGAAEAPGVPALRAALDARTAALLEGPLPPHEADVARCDCDGLQWAWDRFRSECRAALVSLLEAGVQAGALRGDAPALVDPLETAYAAFLPPGLHALPRAEVPARLAAMHRLVLEGLRR